MQTTNSDATAPITTASAFFNSTDMLRFESVALIGASREVTAVNRRNNRIRLI